MGKLSVAEAAERLGVGVSRVHQRIAAGSLQAERIGSQWVIDERSLRQSAGPRKPGRPLSERSAWALVACSRHDQGALGLLDPSERARARVRLRQLLDHARNESFSEFEVRFVAALLRAWFGSRASRRLYRVSPRDLPDLRADGRLVLSGINDPSAGIGSGDVVEAYVRNDAAEALRADYLLSGVAFQQEANVVLHVVADQAVIHPLGPLLVAADLAEHGGPREELRAAELLRSLGQEVR